MTRKAKILVLMDEVVELATMAQDLTNTGAVSLEQKVTQLRDLLNDYLLTEQ